MKEASFIIGESIQLRLRIILKLNLAVILLFASKKQTQRLLLALLVHSKYRKQVIANKFWEKSGLQHVSRQHSEDFWYEFSVEWAAVPFSIHLIVCRLNTLNRLNFIVSLALG